MARQHYDPAPDPVGPQAALRVLETVLGQPVVGRPERLGQGLSYRAWRVRVADGRGGEQLVVVRLPLPDALHDQDEEARRERLVLDALGGLALPFRVPRPLGELRVGQGVAVVQEWLSGLPLLPPWSTAAAPWQLTAEVAAAVHAIDVSRLRDVLPGPETLEDAAHARLRNLAALDLPEAQDAMDWALDHLPPPAPSALVHGDLLGQNLLVDPAEPHPVALIDWGEARLGDPAWDLAVVTRASPRPFKEAAGFARLLSAYNAVAVAPLTAARVRLYELGLLGSWLRNDLEDFGPDDARVLELRHRLRKVLGWALRPEHARAAAAG